MTLPNLGPIAEQLPVELANRLATVVGGLTGDPNATPVVAQGVVPSARLVMSAQPTNNDTIGIGGTTFIFLNTLVAATANVQVLIGASAAATLANLVNAINGNAATAGSTWVEATTPFAAHVLADSVSTSLRIRLATARGITPAIAGVSGSVALTESITAAADIWNAANLNVAGTAPASGQLASNGQVAITAQMITNLSYLIELPFTPANFSYTARTSTGAVRATTDTVAISGNGLLITLAGGASPALQAGDIVSFWATT